jgi:hypothetical protein
MTDHSGLDVRTRLEMLVGLLADELTPTRELVRQIRLRANASYATKSDLEHFLCTTGQSVMTSHSCFLEIKAINAIGTDKEEETEREVNEFVVQRL